MHYNILLDLVCKITTAQRGCWHGGPAVSGFCPDNLVILRKSVNDVGFCVDNLVILGKSGDDAKDFSCFVLQRCCNSFQGWTHIKE